MWATGDSAGRGRWPANLVGNRSGVGWRWDRCAGRGSGRERGAGTKRAKNPCPSVSNREMIDVGAGRWWTGAQRRAAAGSRRGYSEAGGCSLVGWVRRQRRTRTGGLRCVCSGVEDWSGQELVFSRLLGKGGGTWSRAVRAGESRELEFKMLRGRGARELGAVDGGQQGGWVLQCPWRGEERGVRQDLVWWSCWLPVVAAKDGKILPSFNHVFYILQARMVACNSRPTSWSDGPFNTLSRARNSSSSTASVSRPFQSARKQPANWSEKCRLAC